MNVLEQTIALLGTTMKDRVTGQSGMVASVSFDAYGCVQAWLTGKVGKDGKAAESMWLDVKRLESVKGKRVMPQPRFTSTPFGEEIGPAAKASPFNR